MRRILGLSAMATILCASAGHVIASDARSISLGGAVVANGMGVPGALSNPASMMSMQRRGEKTHLRIGFSAEFRDTGNAIDTLIDDDNEDLISDIDREIDILSTTPITCIPTVTDGDEPCLTGTQALSDLSGRVLNILDILDEESIEGLGIADFGMAFTQGRVPFAVNLRVSAAGSGTPDIAEGDRSYISEFGTVFDGDELTLNEVLTSNFLEVDAAGLPLSVQQPEDVLQSEASGGVMLRTQLGLSFATTVAVAGYSVDVGVTPKFSSLLARSLSVRVSDEFVENVPSAADRFDDTEVTETSFTTDVGGSMTLKQVPVQVAAVIRNLIPESITTNEGFEFETTPQLVVGAAIAQGMVTITGDIALNEAKQDNFETQKMGLGVEFGKSILALRGGISHDAARDNDSTSLSLGFGLGPLEVGGRLTGTESAELGAQLSFSF